MTYDSFTFASRNTDIFIIIFDDWLDWIIRTSIKWTIDLGYRRGYTVTVTVHCFEIGTSKNGNLWNLTIGISYSISDFKIVYIYV